MKISIRSRVKFTESMKFSDSSQLTARYIEGDEQAIEMLVRRYETDVYRLTLRIALRCTPAN